MSNRIVFFTFRPQVTDQQLFEDFVLLFLPFIYKHSQYAYSIEKDNTPQRHIHAFMEGNYKDMSKFYQSWNKTNGLKDFKKSMSNTQTTCIHGFNTQIVSESDEDKLKVLGYVLKEQTTRQESNIENQRQLDAVNYYFAHMRIKARDPLKKDWTLLKATNFHTLIEDYLDKNQLKLNDKHLRKRLAKDRYSYGTLSSKQVELFLAEIALARGEPYSKNTSDISILNTHHNNDDAYEKQGYLQSLHNNFIAEYKKVCPCCHVEDGDEHKQFCHHAGKFYHEFYKPIT